MAQDSDRIALSDGAHVEIGGLRLTVAEFWRKRITETEWTPEYRTKRAVVNVWKQKDEDRKLAEEFQREERLREQRALEQEASKQRVTKVINSKKRRAKSPQIGVTPRVRLSLNIPDIVLVIPVVEREDPPNGDHILASTISKRASGLLFKKGYPSEQSRSRRYEGWGRR